MVQPIKHKKIKITKRCKYCPKVLRSFNKSGICSNCRNTYRNKLSLIEKGGDYAKKIY